MTIDEEGAGAATPFGRFLGLETIEAGDGRARVRLALDDRHRNRRGVAHGGVVAALLDAGMGAAVISSMEPEEWCGTVQLSVQFVGPARHGPLEARGEVSRRGRSVALAEGSVLDASGEVVARGQGTWTIWPGHPDRNGGVPTAEGGEAGRAGPL